MRSNQEAANYAAKANQEFGKGVECKRKLTNSSLLLEPLEKFVNAYNVGIYTIIYFGILVADTIFSSNLLRPIVDDFWSDDKAIALAVMLFLYFVMIYALTTAASRYQFEGIKKFIDLRVETELLKNPEGNRDVIERDIKIEIKNNKKWAVFFSVLLLIFILGLGMMRVFVINGRVDMHINDIGDVLYVLIPVLLAALLVFFGMYKTIFFNWRSKKREESRLEAKLESHKSEVIELSHICLSYVQKAKDAGELSSSNKDVCIVIDRQRTMSANDPDFFNGEKTREQLVKVVYRGKLRSGIPVELGIVGGGILRDISDEQGATLFKWNSVSADVFFIKVNGIKIPGARFKAGQSQTIDISLFERGSDEADNDALIPPDKSPTPPQAPVDAQAQQSEKDNFLDKVLKKLN